MGISQHDHAERLARLSPSPIGDTPERGHARGRPYVDRSRTDSVELRGFPLVGRGIPGVIRGTSPGDSAANLERDETELKRALMRQARGNLKRARRSDYA